MDIQSMDLRNVWSMAAAREVAERIVAPIDPSPARKGWKDRRQARRAAKVAEVATAIDREADRQRRAAAVAESAQRTAEQHATPAWYVLDNECVGPRTGPYTDRILARRTVFYSEAGPPPSLGTGRPVSGPLCYADAIAAAAAYNETNAAEIAKSRAAWHAFLNG